MNRSIFSLIGNTPLVETKTLFETGRPESRGVVLAYNMIKSAIERGDINKNSKLIEATSGNTGILLAMITGIMDWMLSL